MIHYERTGRKIREIGDSCRCGEEGDHVVVVRFKNEGAGDVCLSLLFCRGCGMFGYLPSEETSGMAVQNVRRTVEVFLERKRRKEGGADERPD